MPDTIHRGGCACGKIRFEARGEPFRVGICHCLTCRKAHGAPFGYYAVFHPAAVSLKGDMIEFASSGKGRRYACRACGSPVSASYGRADEVYLYPGSFDEPGLFQPTYELWTCRREPWLPEFASVISRYVESRLAWRRTEKE